MGFNQEDIGIHHYDITFYDLGGGKKIRDIWQTYFPEIYGVVYVVDSTASDRMDEIKENLQMLLEDEKVSGKPILLYVPIEILLSTGIGYPVSCCV